MRLFLLGANGRTGREVIALALPRGHQVTAFVRSPEKLAAAPSLTIIPGDPHRPESISSALPGHDAVISTIGPHPRDALRPGTLMADCARATVSAMTAAGVTRLAIVSAAVLFPGRGVQFAFFRWFLRHHARDLRAMESIVKSSSLTWTIARPPRLTRSRDATFRALPDALPPGDPAMSHRSVAAFLLEAVERHAHIYEVTGLSQG